MTFTPASSRSGTGGISSGTSMPASPASGDLFFRTDLGLIAYYDGTRWLSVTLYHEPLGPGESAVGAGTSPGITQRGPAWWASFDLWLVSADIAVYVATTNTGAAFWTCSVNKVNTANVDTSLASFSTAASAADTWVGQTVAIGAALGGAATYPSFCFKQVKSGAPGAAYATAALRYRLIIT